MKWCRIIPRNWLAGFVDAEGWWSRRLQRHLEVCHECRAVFEREQSLCRALRRSAPTVAPDMPPYLKSRIMAHLKADDAPGEARRAGWQWVQPWAVAGIALVLLIAFWPARRIEVGTTTGEISLPVPSSGSATQTELGFTWPLDPVRVRDWASLADQPLQGELENAVADGRMLLAAAVFSVVPDPAAERIMAHAENWMDTERR